MTDLASIDPGTAEVVEIVAPEHSTEDVVRACEAARRQPARSMSWAAATPRRSSGQSPESLTGFRATNSARARQE
jgi:hypothetical protein